MHCLKWWRKRCAEKEEKVNLRRMLEHVNSGQIEKITKMCARGMDPNFHCPESGETPLTLASSLKQPSKIIMALINGGALLDFRTKDGLTALHKAVEKNNIEALKTLLDLGASPNYKDSKGLTPLYYTVSHSSDHQLTELLLHDHAFIGTCDPQGWQEVHQACKHGLVQHLEHLLFYGADMNARNASGNTPLHVCAVNDQESCARVLLFRGAEKNALNFANQSPYQVAVIAGNLNLGELIRNHNPEEVVPYREMPRYNPRRRASIAPVTTLSRTHSDPRLDLHLGMKPPSPCPSNCSLPPFSSMSYISDASTGSSTCTQPSGDDSEDTASGSVVTEKSVTSDSSGVCTSNSESGMEPNASSDIFLPGNICICVTDYSSLVPGHLQLSSGDTIEVINETEDGLLLGRTDSGQVGHFPSSCVQELASKGFDPSHSPGVSRVEGRRERSVKRVSIIPRRWKALGEPRTVILHKGKKGFGFVLRGTKASSPLMEREMNFKLPSQYLEDVGKGGVADLAGLKKGDYLLEINGQDVSQASHEHVVSIIHQSGNLVAMTVITLQNASFGTSTDSHSLPYRQCATLPRKLVSKKAPAPPKRDPKTTLSVGRVRARSMVAGLAEIESLDRSLNEYDSEGRSTKSSSVESIPNKTALKMSDRHLTKTASIKARPSSQRVSAAELEQFFARQGSKTQIRSYTLNSRSRIVNRPPKVYGSVAEMKRSKASRSKLAEASLKIRKDFFSTPDLKASNSNATPSHSIFKKKSLSQEDLHNMEGSRHSWACTPNGYNSYLSLCDNDYGMNYQDAWKSIEDVYDSTVPVATRSTTDIYAQTLPLPKKEKLFRASCPPPSHPPPPPPIGQVVKVDVSKALGEYANVNIMDDERNSQVMSSFRPGDSAKLYASPEVVMSVGYKSETVNVPKDLPQPRRAGGGSGLRSQSLPPKIPANKSDRGSTTSSEAENSGDSGGVYSAFKKTSRQRDSMSTDSGHASDRAAMWTLKEKNTATSAYALKFDFDDSDAGSPQNYPTVRTPSHEPFIPEPDYESSEDDYIPTSVDKGGSLSTFGKGDSTNPDEKVPCEQNHLELQSEVLRPLSPHTEAKRAIQEARERLRFSQKPIDKNATVVFISGKITEHKVEKSEIQLHRTEEGRLTGTVVISTTNEPQEPLYLSSSILKNYETEKYVVPRYPSRDAPASEYAKYRQQILSGMAQPTDEEEAESNSEILDGNNETPEVKDFPNISKDAIQETVKHASVDGIKISLTGTQKHPLENKESPVSKKHSEESHLELKEERCNDTADAESNSTKISSDLETKNDDQMLHSSKEENNSDSVVHTTSVNHVSDNFDKNHVTVTFDVNSKSIEVKEPKSKFDPTNKVPEYSHVEPWTDKNIPVRTSEKSVKKVENQNKEKSCLGKATVRDPYPNVNKTAQMKNKLKAELSSRIVDRKVSSTAASSTESSLEESLEVLRSQVNSLGLAALNEVDVFTDLVPPPPEFAAFSDMNSRKEPPYSASEIAIAPPPEFSDYSSHARSKVSQRASNSQKRNHPMSYQIDPSNSVNLSFLSSLRNKSPNIVQMVRGDKKYNLGSGRGSINLHLPCTSGVRFVPSNITEHSSVQDGSSSSELSRLKSVQKEFRFKLLQEWTANDIADWLDSLFLPEYKQRFSEAGITGAKLANMDSNDLMGLGVKQMGHRLNMERSLKRYLK